MVLKGSDVKKELAKRKITQKAFAEEIGYQPSTLSNWLHKGIPEEIIPIISEKLEIIPEPEFEPEIEFVSMSEAATRLNMSKEGVMSCMRQNAFPYPIGWTWQGRHTKTWNYRISRGLFEKALKLMK